MSEIIQGSDAWRQIRLGKVTGSRVKDVMAKTKTGPSASRQNYLAELVVERRTGSPSEGFSNAAMAWGTEQEPEARRRYEAETGVLVQEVAFVDHPTIQMSGASPDGLVGEDGLVEIKCPNTKTHIETLLANKAPGQYISQMQWQMACTGRAWCDFVSFDPRMPENEQFFCIRVIRDDNYIAEMEKEVIQFLSEVNESIQLLDARLKNVLHKV
jgi:putative phage-type endonuclease